MLHSNSTCMLSASLGWRPTLHEVISIGGEERFWVLESGLKCDSCQERNKGREDVNPFNNQYDVSCHPYSVIAGLPKGQKAFCSWGTAKGPTADQFMTMNFPESVRLELKVTWGAVADQYGWHDSATQMMQILHPMGISFDNFAEALLRMQVRKMLVCIDHAPPPHSTSLLQSGVNVWDAIFVAVPRLGCH